MIFNLYSKYYDLLYKDKKYLKEAAYVHKLLNKYSTFKINNILDVGCGTGIHAQYLAQYGYSIDGVDLSENMIEIAKMRMGEQSRFYVGDGSKFKIGKKYDALISLFHVVNYYTTNNKIKKAFNNASDHLKKGGLFIFDTWYGPGVINDLPSITVKELENNTIKVTRIATPTLYPNENQVDVNYTIFITNKNNSKIDVINEKHTVRYFFKVELSEFLNNAGFELLEYTEWLTGKTPGYDTWGVCFVGRKK